MFSEVVYCRVIRQPLYVGKGLWIKSNVWIVCEFFKVIWYWNLNKKCLNALIVLSTYNIVFIGQIRIVEPEIQPLSRKSVRYLIKHSFRALDKVHAYMSHSKTLNTPVVVVCFLCWISLTNFPYLTLKTLLLWIENKLCLEKLFPWWIKGTYSLI